MFKLPTISQFLSDTINENLRKLLQPAGLFAAAIFVLLNLFLVYPVLLDEHQEFALFFRDLSTLWQIALLSAVVIILSYLLLSLNESVLKLFTGELWDDTPILSTLFRWWQKTRRDLLPTLNECAEQERKLKQTVNEQQKDRENLIAKQVQCWEKSWERMSKFPAEEGYLAPTALGNAINATASQIWQRYRIDMGTLWSPMELILADKDKSLLERVQSEKVTLDFLLNMSFLLLIFWLEYLVLRIIWPDLRTTIIVTLIFLLAFLVFYWTAIGKALSWGLAVRTAFDMHRESLGDAFGMDKFTSRANERAAWRGLSFWLLWGNRKDVESTTKFPFSDEIHSKIWAADRLFQDGLPAPASQDAIVHRHSANVRVDLSTTVAPVMEEPQLPVSTIMREYVDYLVIVSNVAAESDDEACQCLAEDAFLLIIDPRIPAINALPAGPNLQVIGGTVNTEVTGHLFAASAAGHGLLWHINQIAPNGAITLRYRLPSFIVQLDDVEPPVDLVIVEFVHKYLTPLNTYRYTIAVENKSQQPISSAKLRVRDSRVTVESPLKGLLEFDASKVTTEAVVENGSFIWQLASPDRSMQLGEISKLTYYAKKKET